MSWHTTLDAYAAQLDAVQQALSDQLQVIVPAFIPPTDLGPLPADMADRASELWQQGVELDALLREARDALEVAMREVVITARPAPRPSMVDVRA